MLVSWAVYYLTMLDCLKFKKEANLEEELDPLVSSSSESPQSDACPHPVVMNLTCTACGHQMSRVYGLPFDYIEPGLRLSETEADRERVVHTKIALSKRKLMLVLDLDQTLLETTADLTPDEENLMESLQDVFRVKLSSSSYIIKLRPFVRNFLEEANEMFEMFVYTNSVEEYARKITDLLDPDKKFFKSRLIAREHSTKEGRKNLDVVMGEERVVVILDDRHAVWPMHKDNLIQVQKYRYFSSSHKESEPKSLAERKVDEDARIMAAYLEILKNVHRRFFDTKPDESQIAARDVRDVIRKLQAEILEGCTLIIKRGLAEYPHRPLERMAERMGAICVPNLNSSVTHMVTIRQARPAEDELILPDKKRKQKKRNLYHSVKPEWIHDSYKLWQRMPVVDYMP